MRFNDASPSLVTVTVSSVALELLPSYLVATATPVGPKTSEYRYRVVLAS
jgi:hypothetical protein